jgi:hypothetical protein
MSHAIDWEEFVSVKTAIKRGTDAKVPISTAYRWATAGLVISGKRYRMRCRFVGGRIETTAGAVRDFLRQIEQAKIDSATLRANRKPAVA